MAKAIARIYLVASPAGWAWSFDNAVDNGSVDNIGTAATAAAALDQIKPLIGTLPGTLSRVTLNIETFEV